MPRKTSLSEDHKVFYAEMDRRFKEMKNNSVKTITLEELVEGARQEYKKRKHSKRKYKF